MRTFPILHGHGRTIPYDLVKQHERQVVINHSNQTLDRIAERGGLDWVELYCVLNDLPHNKNIPLALAVEYVLTKINEFVEKIEHDKPLDLRPGIVKLEKDKNKFEVDAYFHRWYDKSKVIEPSLLVGGGSGGIINYVVGIIEYEDGTIDECLPKNIKFTDRD